MPGLGLAALRPDFEPQLGWQEPNSVDFFRRFCEFFNQYGLVSHDESGLITLLDPCAESPLPRLEFAAWRPDFESQWGWQEPKSVDFFRRFCEFFTQYGLGNPPESVSITLFDPCAESPLPEH